MKIKKHLSLLLVFCLIISLLMTIFKFPVFAAELPTVENNTIYANGTSITLKKDIDDSVYVYDSSGTQKLYDKAVSNPVIYDGSKNKNAEGNVTITIDGVSYSRIYGGGYSDGTGSADLNGNITINVLGNTNANTINGGGYAISTKGNAQANVTGNVTINITAIPPSNHETINGGGYAYSHTQYSATAKVYGNISIAITSRTYSVRGGGQASINNSGNYANADVSGNISIHLNQVDIREVYGGGYASGNAQASVNNVNINCINNSEVMILEGGGYASGSGIALANDINISVTDAINLYGYIRGGGSSYSGGNADVNNVYLTLTHSLVPIEEQFGSLVAAGIYGGGYATGEGSHANVSTVTLNISEMQTGGTIYNGGDSSNGGTATVIKSIANYVNNTGIEYEGTLYYSTIIGGGSGANAELINITESQINIINSVFENIWGGGENNGSPIALKGISTLSLDKEIRVNTLANFNNIYLTDPLHVTMVMGKDEQTPTTLIIDDLIPVGTPLVYCDDIEGMENTFVINDGKIAYSIEENQSVWKVGQMTYTIETRCNNGGTITTNQTVNKFGDVTISWKANSEYRVAYIKIDDILVEATDTYTFKNVKSNHKVEVNFEKIPGEVNDNVQIEKDPNANLPDVKVALNQEVISNLLTEEDKQAIADGKNIEFSVEIKEVKKIPENILTKINEVVDKENVLMNIDLNLFKYIDKDSTAMSQTNTPLRFTIDIPEIYLKQNKEKQFAIVRNHLNEDGSITTDVLKDLDDNEKTITFETDRFSIYTLIYDVPKDKEEPTEPPVIPDDSQTPQPPIDGNGDDITGTIEPTEDTNLKNDDILNVIESTNTNNVDSGDNTHYQFYLVSLISSIFGLYLIIKKTKNYSRK